MEEGNACTCARKGRGELFGRATVQFRSTPRRHEIKTGASGGVNGQIGRGEVCREGISSGKKRYMQMNGSDAKKEVYGRTGVVD